MQAAASELNKVWLAGGSRSASWTYAQLNVATATPPKAGPSPASVTSVLIEFVRALRHGRNVELGEATFAGEGLAMPPAMDSGAYPPDMGLNEFAASLLRPRDLEVTLLSSGSTGKPRAIAHRLAGLLRTAVAGTRHREDVWGLAFNPTQMAGVQVFLQALTNANTIVNLWGIERSEVVKRCRDWGVTHLSATPTFYRLLLPLEEPLSAIRSITVGGETTDERLLARLQEAFPLARMHNIYASTEAGALLVSNGVEFSFPDENRDRMRITDSRLWVHSSLLGRFNGASDWYDTGDAVEITQTEPLRFRIAGRWRSVINVGGEKVNPHEVEAVLAEHPAIVAARVFGRHNSVTGEILTAEIVARGTIVPEPDLREYLAQRLPAYKIPRIIRYVDQPDLTRSGKVKRDA